MSLWEQLGSCPFMASHGSLHQGIEEGQLMYISRRHLNYKTLESNSSAIYLYNINKQSWSRYKYTPSNIEHHTAVFDENDKLLYIKDASSNVFIINFKDNKHKQYTTNTSARINPSILINHKFNIFDGDKHIIWNNKENKFNEEYESLIPSTVNIQSCSVAYIPFNDSLLLFGGMTRNYKSDDIMHSYCIKTKKWKKLSLKLPIPLRLIGYTSTLDKKYIIIFGGITNRNNSKNIYILNTQNMKFRKSKIIFPFNSNGCKVIIPNNTITEELTVFGYIRNIWNINKEIMNNIQYLPHYMIKLLSQFYSNQYIHLIQTDEKQNNHWRIKLDHILHEI